MMTFSTSLLGQRLPVHQELVLSLTEVLSQASTLRFSPEAFPWSQSTGIAQWSALVC